MSTDLVPLTLSPSFFTSSICSVCDVRCVWQSTTRSGSSGYLYFYAVHHLSLDLSVSLSLSLWYKLAIPILIGNFTDMAISMTDTSLKMMNGSSDTLRDDAIDQHRGRVGSNINLATCCSAEGVNFGRWVTDNFLFRRWRAEEITWRVHHIYAKETTFGPDLS